MTNHALVIRPQLEVLPDFMRPLVKQPQGILNDDYAGQPAHPVAIGFRFALLGPGLVVSDSLGLFVRHADGSVATHSAFCELSKHLSNATRRAKQSVLPSPRGLTDIARRHGLIGHSLQHLMLLMLQDCCILSLAADVEWPLEQLATGERSTTAVVIASMEGSNHEQMHRITRLTQGIDVWRTITREAYEAREASHNLAFDASPLQPR